MIADGPSPFSIMNRISAFTAIFAAVKVLTLADLGSLNGASLLMTAEICSKSTS
jgi:hypothetical protein